jgi:hypothetical protein
MREVHIHTLHACSQRHTTVYKTWLSTGIMIGAAAARRLLSRASAGKQWIMRLCCQQPQPCAVATACQCVEYTWNVHLPALPTHPHPPTRVLPEYHLEQGPLCTCQVNHLLDPGRKESKKTDIQHRWAAVRLALKGGR